MGQQEKQELQVLYTIVSSFLVIVGLFTAFLDGGTGLMNVGGATAHTLEATAAVAGFMMLFNRIWSTIRNLYRAINLRNRLRGVMQTVDRYLGVFGINGAAIY